MKSKIFSIFMLIIAFSYALNGMQENPGADFLQRQRAMDGEGENEAGPSAKTGRRKKGKEKGEKRRKKKAKSPQAKDLPYQPRPVNDRKSSVVPGPLNDISEGISVLTGLAVNAAKVPGHVGDWIRNQVERGAQQMFENDAKKAKNQRRIDRQLATEHITYNIAHINAVQHRKGQVRAARASAREWMDLIKKNSYILAGITTLTAVGFFAAKNGMKVFFDELEKILGRPKLAHETSLLTFREKIAKRLGLRKERVLKTEDLIFNASFKNRIDNLSNSLKHTVSNNGILRNMLFYGVPGTGKTLTAQTIAQNCGLHYSYFAASSLAKMSEKEALNQVTELFEFAKKSPEKLMIIIDEAETLFADRGNSELDAQMKKILNLILTYTGTESQDYCVVALTNRPEDLDEAVLSRFGEQIEFPLPATDEIKTLLDLYIKKLLKTPRMVKTGWLGRKVAKSIKIESNALDHQAIEAIAHKIQGFVGRDITQLVVAFQAEAFANEHMLLTKHMVEEIVDRKIAEKKKAAQKFKNS